jgi:3-methyladenine DNA glycosylase AlkD
MTAAEVVERLRKLADPKAVHSAASFGIQSKVMYGITTPVLQKLARPIGRDQQLSLDLWRTGIMEARIIAAFIGEPAKVTSGQMESWLKDFDSWAVCDCCCCYLFDKTKDAYKKAIAWSRSKAEYEKRAAFALMAYLAVHDKPAPDDAFLKFLPIIAREAWDDRNFVKKAVNWALRQIGKRNRALNQAAIQTAREIREQGTRAARWIAADALRELESEAVQRRLTGRLDASATG